MTSTNRDNLKLIKKIRLKDKIFIGGKQYRLTGLTQFSPISVHFRTLRRIKYAS